MKPRFLVLSLSAILTLGGCVTAPEKTAGTGAAETVVETDAPMEAPAHVGSHIRSKTKSRKDSAEAAFKLSGEQFNQQNNAARSDASAEQIMNARTEGR